MKTFFAILVAVSVFLVVGMTVEIALAYVQIVTDNRHLAHYNSIPAFLTSYISAAKAYGMINRNNK